MSVGTQILALLGLAAVAASAALLCARPLIAALDGALTKWRRMGFVPRVVAVMMAAVATVEAQKSGGRGIDDFSRVERVDRVGGEGEELRLGVEVEQRTDKPSAVQLGLETSTHLLVSVKTNDSYSYSMPTTAVRYPNWWMRGGYEDVFKLELGDWRFPIGTNLVDSLWVYTWGKVRPRLKAKELEIVVAQTPMSAVPQVSEFWYMDGTNGSKILTWHNFFLGRIPLAALANSEFPPTLPDSTRSARSTRLDDSVLPISVQLELLPNGDYIARSNLVERYYKRINPDDWDDDGIPNEADANPSVSDGDFFGPQEDELPEGAEASNYCWVDIVVSNANSLVTFVGDKPSNLSDPRFIAKARTTHRVNLLIGKTYRVSSAIPVFCIAKSSDEIYVSGEGTKEMTVVYPVSYEIMDNARSVSRQVRMIPPLVGTFNWGTTNRCCDIGNVSGAGLPSCSLGCTCEGCTSGGFTFNYEGYSLSFDGMECGCKPYSGPTEDDGPYDASVSVAFSEKAIIFEDAYENKPGESVPKQSTRTVLSCVAHGGPNGGRARFTISNAEKLVRLSGIDLPMEVDVPAGNKVEFNIVYEGCEASGSENDIVATAQFIDNKDGVLGSVEDELTVVKILITPQVQVATLEHRHIWGVGERVLCEWEPNGIHMNVVSKEGDIDNDDFWIGPTFRYFISPFRVADKVVVFEYAGEVYVPDTKVIEPQLLIAQNAEETFFNLEFGVPGGAGFTADVYVKPSEVSFQKIHLMEVPSFDSAIDGYFTHEAFSNVWYHTIERGAGTRYRVSGDNFVFKDEVKMGDSLILPVCSGHLVWHIPIMWIGGSVTNYLPVSYKQSFDMTQSGNLRVSKFELWAERNIFNERNVSEGVSRCEQGR